MQWRGITYSYTCGIGALKLGQMKFNNILPYR